MYIDDFIRPVFCDPRLIYHRDEYLTLLEGYKAEDEQKLHSMLKLTLTGCTRER